MAGIEEDALRPTLQCIEALALYLEAINKIVGVKAPKVSGDLFDAYDTASTALDDIVTIAGRPKPALPTLTADQKTAVTGLIDLIVELRDQSNKIARLRALAIEQGPRADAVIDALQRSVTLWQNSSLTSDLELIGNVYTGIGRRLAEQPPIYPQFETRQSLLRQLVAAERAANAAPAVADTVRAALSEVREAQRQLIDGLSRNPQWSAAEREKIAKINRDRLLKALHSIAAITALM